MSTSTPTVALGADLLTSMTKLPQSIMKKAKDAIAKFKMNPLNPGLNLEKINHDDRRIYSIRIDLNYRGIVLKSKTDDTFILLWIDKHDDAYDWAKKRRFGIHAQTGAIQIIETTHAADEIEPSQPTYASTEDTRPDIFVQFSDKDLEKLGATEDTLPLIRNIKEDDDIEKLQRRLPPELYEGLFLLACDEPYDKVLDELGIKPDQTFDPEDFQTALKLDKNQQNFFSITDDAELEAILNEPMAKWRVFLHPSQRKLVRANFNGPARVLGGAGTGKTVVAMHRAKYLASQCGKHDKVLFTTFTKSLINDIQNNMQKICSYDEIRKIDIIHIDKWCHNFLRSKHLNNEIAYENHPLRKKLWKQALELLETDDFDENFLKTEWDKVIQYHDIDTFQQYARIPRAGRRGRLQRLQRKQIWPVFEDYRALLVENQLWEPADMFRAARQLLNQGDNTSGFKHIIVDEIQDLHPQAFRLLRAMIPEDDLHKNDLFLVGDGHQSLYGHHIVMSQLGINIRGRGRRLKLNYRTPEETRKWASSILADVAVSDLDGELDSSKGYRSLISGPEPVFKSCASFSEEIKTIKEWIEGIKSKQPNQVICVTLRKVNARVQYAEALADAGFDIHIITSDNHDIDDPSPIRFVTMHRIKGLEFDHVCIADCSKNTWQKYQNDPDRLNAEKCLLHVAATRTKNSLLITATGEVFKH